ncbi:MAG TPA: hypothetical protein VIL85_09975 [Thermomicrobiales bacterium]
MPAGRAGCGVHPRSRKKGTVKVMLSTGKPFTTTLILSIFLGGLGIDRF